MTYGSALARRDAVGSAYFCLGGQENVGIGVENCKKNR
jgi:hypothetical protein